MSKWSSCLKSIPAYSASARTTYSWQKPKTITFAPEGMKEINRGYTFRRHERLRGRKNVGELFQTKESFFHYPFKVLILRSDTGTGLRILITVSKRNHSKAVDRNRVKRLIREAWRLNKAALLERLLVSGKSMDIALIYTAKEIYPQQLISLKINKLIVRLIETHETPL